jgi:hypothetical protein
LLLLALVAIAPLPAAFSNLTLSYTSRAFFLSPLLCIVIGYGWVGLKAQDLGRKTLVSLGIAFLYLISILYFCLVYFLQFPIINPEAFSFSYRILAKYLSLERQTGNQIVVIAGSPMNAAMQYYFYTLRTNASFQKLDKLQIKRDDFVYDTIHFTRCPAKLDLIKNMTVITESGYICPALQNLVPSFPKKMVIPRLDDAGSIFFIYGSSTCSHQKLKLFPMGITFADLEVEKLLQTDFCRKFIIQYL